uniref:ORF40 n=1 Tax=Nitrosopumilaceae spindle-shaped virus TaxID=3065433 RepID=A0AAT9JAU3_9VIRU
MKAHNILFIVLLGFCFVPVFADQYGIQLGTTCMTMLKNNIPGCPSYEELDVLFPDNTDSRLGQLTEIDGIIQRDQPQFLAPEQFYRYSTKDVIWLDPPEEVRKRIKMITIEPSLPPYKIGQESKKMDDYNVKFGKDRYINANCSEIKITAKNWLFMTGDALNLLKHKCDMSVSTFDASISYNFTKSYQDISTSAKYKHDLWVKKSLIDCKERGC